MELVRPAVGRVGERVIRPSRSSAVSISLAAWRVLPQERATWAAERPGDVAIIMRVANRGEVSPNSASSVSIADRMLSQAWRTTKLSTGP